MRGPRAGAGPESGGPAAAEPRERAVREVRQALEAGRITVPDVDRFLRSQRRRRRHPSVPALLYAFGAVVAFFGSAMAYATVFADLPWRLQLTTPFIFPIVAVGVSIALATRRHRWQSAVAGVIGCGALSAACAASIAASGWVDTTREGAGLAALSAVLVAGAGAGLYFTIGSRLVAWLVVPPALGVAVACSAFAAGVTLEWIAWIVLAEAAVAAGASWLAAARHPGASAFGALWALVGVYASVIVAGIVAGLDHFSVWHVILAVAVALAFTVAGARELDAMMVLAALGGAFWIVMIATIVGSATSAALAVVVAGLALVGLGLLVAHVHGRRSPRSI